MNEKKYDVVVIGAGPAGCTAATLLAKKGYSIALLEKEKHPRYTVGESLIPHFWRYTDMLGVSEDIKSANFIIKSGGVVSWGDHVRSVELKDFGFDRPALHVERDEFDHILFKNAKKNGVDTFENTRALKVETIQSGISKVHYSTQLNEKSEQGTLTARYVVDSSGQVTLLSKQNSQKVFDEGFRFHAVWSYFDEMNYMSSMEKYCQFHERRTHSPKTLISKEGNWGWIWQIVMKDNVSVGLILEREHLDAFKKKGEDLKTRFVNTIRDNPIILRMMTSDQLVDDKVYSVRDYSYKSEKLTVDNTILIGDAAAFVDPINSAGIIMAFYTGYFSSWVLDRSLKKPLQAEKYFNMYEQVVKSTFDLFRTIAVPEKIVSQSTLQACKQAFSLLSNNELQLLMAQIFMTQRAENIPAFLEALGIKHVNHLEKMPKDEFISLLDQKITGTLAG